MDITNEIIDFIERRWQSDAGWLDENCYYFAKILQYRFPSLDIYYEPVDGHFLAGDGKHFYDWIGEYTDRNPILFSEIRDTDPLWYERLIRDCIK